MDSSDMSEDRVYLNWQWKLIRLFNHHSTWIKPVGTVVFTLAAGAFVVCALNHSVEKNIAVIVFSAFGILLSVCVLSKSCLSKRLKRFQLTESQEKIARQLKRCAWLILPLGVFVFILVDVSLRSSAQLRSLGGIAAFILFSLVCSKNPSKIPWDVVVSGLVLQVVLALLVLRWSPAADALEWLGQQISVFMAYSTSGAQRVFGKGYVQHPFAMQVLPAIIWWAAVSCVLQHWNVLQPVVALVGGAVKLIVGTSTVESFVAVAGIFLGPDGPILMVLPMIAGVTQAQLFCMISSGLATIDGGTLGIFVSMGIPAKHLVVASILSAPAVLMISKMLVPEKTNIIDFQVSFHKSEAKSSLEAFVGGATMGGSIAAAVLTTLIGFIALLELANRTFSWFGDRVGIFELTLQKLLGWILTPVAFMIGVPWEDCTIVAQLIGIKTILNEFIAYIELSTYIGNRLESKQPFISEKSEAIATYALCGYSNVGTISTMLGFIAVVAPTRFRDLSDVALRTVVSSSVACLLTSAIAGLLYIE